MTHFPSSKETFAAPLTSSKPTESFFPSETRFNQSWSAKVSLDSIFSAILPAFLRNFFSVLSLISEEAATGVEGDDDRLRFFNAGSPFSCPFSTGAGVDETSSLGRLEFAFEPVPPLSPFFFLFLTWSS